MSQSDKYGEDFDPRWLEPGGVVPVDAKTVGTLIRVLSEWIAAHRDLTLRVAKAEAAARSAIVTCETCRGSGSGRAFDTTRGPDGDEHEVACPDCNGTGASSALSAEASTMPKKIERVCPRCRTHAYHWLAGKRAACVNCGHEWTVRVMEKDL